MSLTKFTENMSIISELPDAPTETAQELKAKFDEAGRKIKEYLNNTLTIETDHLVATEKTSLQTLIANTKTQLETEIGNVENSIPDTKNAHDSSSNNTYNCNYINRITDYSIEEKVVGTWINGKPIYQKTISLGYLPNASTKTFPLNISNLNKIIDYECIYQNDSICETYTENYNDGTHFIATRVNSSGSLIIGADSNRSNLWGYVTIKYTKTTD